MSSMYKKVLKVAPKAKDCPHYDDARVEGRRLKIMHYVPSKSVIKKLSKLPGVIRIISKDCKSWWSGMYIKSSEKALCIYYNKN